MDWQRFVTQVISLAALTVSVIVSALFGWNGWIESHRPYLLKVRDQSPPRPNVTAIEWGLQGFYKVNGRWPSNWKEVRQSLIYQTDLYTVDDKRRRIDPDDGSLDFAGDIVYVPRSFPFLIYKGKVLPQHVRLVPPQEYKQSLPLVEQGFRTGAHINWQPRVSRNYGFRADKFLSNKDRLVQLAILGELRELSDESMHQLGFTMFTIDNLLKAQGSPIDRSSTNPVTRKPFKFDGSANDVMVMNGPEGPLTFVPMPQDGSIPTYFFEP
jgi:hypothetical protein